MKVFMLGNGSKKEIEERIKIVASAGSLSRFNGKVSDVIKSNFDFEHNLKLATNIIGYGHRSIAEHDYLVFGIEDVTPIIEQILISYRLTSFTIKSRRNVDFRNAGFYIPDFKDKDGLILEDNKALQNEYINYMNELFSKYGDMVDYGIPVEDARYILPYSYYSNIIMGCDANELLRITSDMLYGKISKITEVYSLGLKFKDLIIKKVPYLLNALNKESLKNYNEDMFSYLDSIVKFDSSLLKKVNLINYDKNSDDIVLSSILSSRYNLPYDKSRKILKKILFDNDALKDKLIDSLLHSKSQRELEQVNYSFEFSISLASLTHISRHRMHSMLIPDFVPLWNLNNYVLPESIKEVNSRLYKQIYRRNSDMVLKFKNSGVRDEDLVYFYLSGNSCNVSTTMNARNLCWISRMRCCLKAQWEIRNIVNDMVKLVKNVSPFIGKMLGPTCSVMGYCPEGKDSCKNRGVVILKK